MSAVDEIFVQLLERKYGRIAIEADSIHFPCHLDKANIPQIYQGLWVGVHFYKFSIKIRVTTRNEGFQVTSLPKLFEIIHKLNLVLDNGSIKYDERKQYIYFSNYLNREGYLSETLSETFLSTIFISIEAFGKFIEFLIKNNSEDIADYEKEFKKNPLDSWLERKEKGSDGSDMHDESSYDYEKLCNKNSIEKIENDKSVIEKLKSDQNLWKMCDHENFDVETVLYDFNPMDLMIVKLKKYNINNAFLKEVRNFMVSLWDIEIVFKHLPLDWIMVSVNEKNEIITFQFALKFTEPMEYYKNGKSKFNHVEDYKDFMGNKLRAAVTKEYNELYPESLLRIQDFTEKDFKEMTSLGKGGCGKVFKNTYKSREVAIKRLSYKKKKKMGPNTRILHEFKLKELEKRILHEFNILKELENQYIVKVYGLVKIKEKLCLVMEYCEGDSLKNKIPLLDPKMKLNIMKKVAIVLGKIHQNGVIHCDVKPSNILFSKEDSQTPKIIDFGLAMKGEEDFQRGFTPFYASPEQLSNHTVDYSTDVWSYGMTYYHVLENKTPFENLGKIPNEILLKKINEPYRPKFSEEVSKNNCEEKLIIERCWKSKKDQRISLSEILEKIDPIEKKNR